jgi:hypothetical protein
MSEETCKIVYTFDISFYNIYFWTCDILHKNDVYSGSIEKSCLDLNWWIFFISLSLFHTFEFAMFVDDEVIDWIGNWSKLICQTTLHKCNEQNNFT